MSVSAVQSCRDNSEVFTLQTHVQVHICVQREGYVKSPPRASLPELCVRSRFLAALWRTVGTVKDCSYDFEDWMYASSLTNGNWFPYSVFTCCKYA